MSNPLLQTIEALAKEKGIEPELVITAIEDAVLTASRKHYKSTENLRTKFNQETGQVELFSVRQIVDEVADPLTEISLVDAQELYGDEAEVEMEIEYPKTMEGLGRIAAQTAKQVIFQKVREAERDNVYEEFNERVGEVIGGTVKRFESGDIIVEMGRVEAILRRRDQSRAENYVIGDRIRAVIVDVTKDTKSQQIILSRTHEDLLIKMFEQEVPEIYDGTVEIKGAVREAGDRAKVAVYSRERDIDPVGACVGMKGTRVQAIIRELRGEKIDIVEWSEDTILFVTNAISPAKIQRVSVLDETERIIEIVVEDSQLSLAIGKKGQNVRLAARLTGWKIDIKSENEKRREAEAAFEGLEEGAEAATLTLPGLDDEQLVRLSNAGLDTAEVLLETTPEHLAEVAGVDEPTAVELQTAIREQVVAAEKAAAALAQDELETSEDGSKESEETVVADGDSGESQLESATDTAPQTASEEEPENKAISESVSDQTTVEQSNEGDRES